MFNTIEEALAHACEVQWQSVDFDAQRDVSIEIFSDRKNFCRSCEYLNNSSHCEVSSDFMPMAARSKYEFCPLEKWLEIEKAPDVPFPPPSESSTESL